MLDTATESSRTGSSPPGSGWVVACCLLLVAGTFVGVAAAHTELADTSPDDGAQLEDPPSEVVLEFAGERIQAAEVDVAGPGGDAVGGEATVEGSDVVAAPVEADGEGVYTVRWEILAEDGHTTSGAFFFVVGDEELDREQVLAAHGDGDGGTGGAPPLGESAIKGLLLASLLVLLGAPRTIAAVAPSVNRFDLQSRTGRRRARALVAAAASALLVAVTLLGVVRIVTVPGSPLDPTRTFVGTSVGRGWVLQVVLAGSVLSAVSWGRRRDDPGVWLLSGFLGAVAIAVTIGWTSHSATLVGRSLGAAVGVAHLVGAAVWVGGLVAMGVVVPPYLRAADEETTREATASVAEVFSLLAAAGLVAVSATGLVLLSWHVPDATRLLSTAYGRLLTVKLALFALAFGFGGINRFLLLRRLHGSEASPARPWRGAETGARPDGGSRRTPGRTARTFVRSVRVEGAVLLAVVLLSGALTSAPTAAVAASAGGDGVQRVEAGDVEVVLDPTPATANDEGTAIDAGEPVVFDVRFSVDGGPPGDVEDVTLTLVDPSEDDSGELEPEYVDEGTYSVLHTVPSNGSWTLRVDAFVDGTYVGEGFDLVVDRDPEATDDSEQPTDDEYDEAAGALAVVARAAAVGVGLVGALAVALEVRGYRSAAPRRRTES